MPLPRVIVERACYFGVYDTLKKDEYSIIHKFATAYCSMVLGRFLSTPFHNVLVRTYSEKGFFYTGPFDCLIKITKHSGSKAPFEGAFIRARDFPIVIALVLYDELQARLNHGLAAQALLVYKSKKL